MRGTDDRERREFPGSEFHCGNAHLLLMQGPQQTQPFTGFVSIATSQDTWQGAAHNLLEELEGPLALDQEEMVKNKLMGRK